MVFESSKRERKSRQKMTQEEFIEAAKSVYGDKYTYDKTVYVNSKQKVIITCPIHGDFLIKPSAFLHGGQDCPKCRYERFHKSTQDWIDLFKEKHGDKFDYSLVKEIKHRNDKISIRCIKHDLIFEQTAITHLHSKVACPLCKKESIGSKNKWTLEKFIAKARKVHGDRYDYSKVEYVDYETPVCIICKKHGEFWQRPDSHTRGYGCLLCGNERGAKVRCDTTETFITKARLVHGDRYDYSKVEYVDSKTKVCIICKEHGEFWQEPHAHLTGKGCPKCKGSKTEISINDYLEMNNIPFIPECKFEWLKIYNDNMRIDFYLPDYNVAIECQGQQHFEPIKYMGGVSDFFKRVERDIKKREMCIEHDVRIYYYADFKGAKHYDFPYQVFTDKDVMFDNIKNGVVIDYGYKSILNKKENEDELY